jgi:hypothetical protein
VVTFVTGAEHAQLEQLSLKEVRSLWFIVHRMIATQLKKDETICDKARLRQPHGLPNDYWNTTASPAASPCEHKEDT